MIPLMKNAFLNEFETRQRLADFITRNNKLSMGEECFSFETEFAKVQGCREAVLVNSGGSANLAIFQTLKNLGKLKNGDRIGFSALTRITSLLFFIAILGNWYGLLGLSFAVLFSSISETIFLSLLFFRTK